MYHIGYALPFIVLCIILVSVFGNLQCDDDTASNYAMIDAGSAGTRIYIYQYCSMNAIKSLKEVASYKISIGLSTKFAEKNEIKTTVLQLLAFGSKYNYND